MYDNIRVAVYMATCYLSRGREGEGDEGDREGREVDEGGIGYGGGATCGGSAVK